MQKNYLNNPKRVSINVEDLELHQHSDYSEQRLPDELGQGVTQSYQIDQDLLFMETCYCAKRDLAVRSKMDFQEPRLVLTLSLQGNSCFIPNQGDKLYFERGYSSITTFNSSIGERQYQADLTVVQLRFSTSRNWLEDYCGKNAATKIFKNSGIQQLSYQPATQNTLIAAKQLKILTVPDNMQALHRHSLALVILSSELSRLCEEKATGQTKMSFKDREIAEHAREILDNEFQHPPTIANLARRVGTNQLKLKQVFHHYFQNTPYGILLEIRMQHAYSMLEQQQCHVAIVADAVGYAHASNFSTAFIKYFGISPKAIAGKAKS